MNTEKKVQATSQRWIGYLGYRKELEVMDCTIRDGGLMNSSRFEDKIVRAVYDACGDANIDYMEIGYKNSKEIYSVDKFGAWRFCDEDDVNRIIGDKKRNVKIAVMADAEKCDYKTDIVEKSQSPIDVIRVATYIHQIPLALDMIKDATDKGYETTVNLMAVSTVREAELDEGLEMLADSDVGTIYLVDSFGSLYCEQVRYMMNKYIKIAGMAGKRIGIHAHNNLQLAFANTVEAINSGANLVDGTLAGLGRGAGNCPLEMLVGFLHNPKYRMRPLLECVEKHIEPLRKELGWGFDYPYMMTGFLNNHPRSAMEYNENPQTRGKIVDFYDKIMR
jgi:4-hydroxy 2-oxovalerate aldolase